MATKVKKPKVVKEIPVVVEPREVLVFWHKSCTDIKKTTKTKIKPEEHLTLTNGTVTIDEKLIPVYSLKRGKRIYYLIDVTPQDIVKAEEIAKAKLANETPTE